MSLLTPTEVAAQNNDRAVNAAVVELRSSVQRCVEVHNYHGMVVLQIDICGGRVSLAKINVEKKLKS